MPRTNIVQIAVGIPRDKRDHLEAFATRAGFRNAATLARHLLSEASGLDLDVQHGGLRAGAGRKKPE